MNKVIEDFLKKRGKTPVENEKKTLKASEIKTDKQFRDLLLKVASDLGYVE